MLWKKFRKIFMQLMIKIKEMSTIRIFSGISPESIEFIIEYLMNQRVNYPKNDILINS
jgi:hypothetical protein